MRVLPSNCTNGSITVSAATSTSASMTQVSGRKMVTPCGHQAAGRRRAHGGVQRHQLGDGVCAQHFGCLGGLNGHHALACRAQQPGHIGQV